jgi:hypothetical protein
MGLPNDSFSHLRALLERDWGGGGRKGERTCQHSDGRVMTWHMYSNSNIPPGIIGSQKVYNTNTRRCNLKQSNVESARNATTSLLT